jgi:transposase-like protein
VDNPNLRFDEDRNEPKASEIASPEEYVIKHGTFCPSCGSPYLIGYGFYATGMHVYQKVECPGCYSKWTDEYKLVGYVEFKKGEN